MGGGWRQLTNYQAGSAPTNSNSQPPHHQEFQTLFEIEPTAGKRSGNGTKIQLHNFTKRRKKDHVCNALKLRSIKSPVEMRE